MSIVTKILCYDIRKIVYTGTDTAAVIAVIQFSLHSPAAVRVSSSNTTPKQSSQKLALSTAMQNSLTQTSITEEVHDLETITTPSFFARNWIEYLANTNKALWDSKFPPRLYCTGAEIMHTIGCAAVRFESLILLCRLQSIDITNY